MKNLKPEWSSTCLCLLLSYSTQAGIHVFILGCITVVLPKTEAHWPEVILDLKAIQQLTQSVHVDATLYTESHADLNCKVTALRCFLLELHVISHECKNDEIQQTVENILILANNNLSSKWNVTEDGCKQCEELEEKNVAEFIQSFIEIVQWFMSKENH